MFKATTAVQKLLKLHKRIRGVAGGTSASKTVSILQILIDKAQSDKVPTLTSVVSESFPHLKRGAIRDFLNIMQAHNYYDDNRWNKTYYTYTFETGSRIEFFSADMPSKVRGPRRERLFINEANNVPYEAFDQLEVRTRDETWLDWNPTNEFWFYTDVQGARDDVDFITLTYRDNEGLAESIVKSIEARMGNKSWWTVYGLGKLGEVEGKIYKGWKTDLAEIPHEARLLRRGLDFGYSNDPAVLISIYYYNGGYILDEELYQVGMTNKQISDVINNLEDRQVLIIADSAEPKSIDEMKLYGVNVSPAQKGPGSVSQGINWVQSQQISVTKRSINTIKEYRNYMWRTDKDGKILSVPEDAFNHAMDAIRYGLEAVRPQEIKVYKPAKMLARKYGR